MKPKVISYLVFGLIDVLCGATLPRANPSGANSVISPESQATNRVIEANFKHLIISVVKNELTDLKSHSLRSESPDELSVAFMCILDDEESVRHTGNLLEAKEKLYFLCRDEVVDYIIKNYIKQVKFFKENCVEKSLESYLPKRVERRLMQKSETEPISEEKLGKTELYDVDEKDSNNESDNCEIHFQEPHDTNFKTSSDYKIDRGNVEEEMSESSCCKSKGKYKRLESAIPNNIRDLLDEKNLSKLDGFDISEVVQSEDGTVDFNIQINGINSIFEEIFIALKSEDNSGISYSSIEERELSNAELKEALRETEKEINNRKVKIRNLGEDIQVGSNNSESLRHTRNTNFIDIKIKNEVNGVSLSNLAERLTQRFVQTEEFKNYVSSTKTRLLFLSIYEFLLIYSTVEENLEQVVEIINTEDGIQKLRSFFGEYVNFHLMKYVFEQYFAEYDHAQGRRIYDKSDFVRFMINLNTNKLNPVLTSPIFHFKLEIGFMIVFYSKEEPKSPKIIIENYINDTKRQKFYKDNAFFNFMFLKHFPSWNKSQLLKKTNEIILNNKRANPLDRPKLCFILVKRALLGYKIMINTQNSELLKAICLRTYGLIGIKSSFNRI